MSLLSLLVGPMTSVWNGYQERKTNEKLLKDKLTGKKLDNEARAGFNDQEWEMLSKRMAGDSWTDEYALVVVTLPLVLVTVCTFLAVLLAKPELIHAAQSTVTAVKSLLPNYDSILEIAILGAIGIKGYKTVVK